jgi:hypothetical protein
MALDVHTNTYKASGLDASVWSNLSIYGLSVPDVGVDMAGAVATPDGFDDIQPVGILNPADTAFTQEISAENATFSWAPSGTSDGLAISLMVYDGASYAYKGEVLCWAPDSGNFTIPSSYFYSPVPYSVSDVLFVAIHKYRTTLSPNPIDGGLVEAVAKKGVIGTGILAP